MASDSTSGPDSSKLDPMAATVAATQADDCNFENDFAVLAARFAAQSGGGLSPELSAELALEIVLSEIVEQACWATGATGAAIVLRRDGEMICRARSGLTAPELGSRLDEAFGLSGECIRTRRTQRCDDVLVDQRVDREASRRLGVRSVTVMPLLRGAELVGVFELFSSQPASFGEQAELKLEALAGRILSSLARAGQFSQPQPEPRSIAESIEESIFEIPPSPPSGGLDLLTWILGAAVLACAILLGIVIGRHPGTQKRTLRLHPAPASTVAAKSEVGSTADAGISSQQATGNPPVRRPAATTADKTAVSPGGLLVFENGKEVFRMPPGKDETGRKQSEESPVEPSPEQRIGTPGASSEELKEVVRLSPTEAEGRLLHRVEPEYPVNARRAGIQGAVVLDIRIDSEGAVQNVGLVSGPPELVQASIDAVKQWRFKPHLGDGRRMGMQTILTLNFRLPL